MPRRTLTHLDRSLVGFTGAPTIIDKNAGGSTSGLANDGNWVVKNVTSKAIKTNKPFSLDLNNGRAICLGGEGLINPLWDRDTGLSIASRFPLQRLKFSTTTGVSGGYKLRTAISGTAPVTDVIPWDSSASYIAGALTAAAGATINVTAEATAGSFLVWEAPSVNGLPANKLGRIQITQQPTGATIAQSMVGQWYDAGQGGDIKDFDSVWLEGMVLRGPGVLEGLNFFSARTGTKVYIVSCYLATELVPHPDFQHPDAAQFYTGPNNLYIEKTFVDSTVNGLMIQPSAVWDDATLGTFVTGEYKIWDTVIRCRSHYRFPNTRPNGSYDINGAPSGFAWTEASGNYLWMDRVLGDTIPGATDPITTENKLYDASSPNYGPRDGIPAGSVPVVAVPTNKTIPAGFTVVTGHSPTFPAGVGCNPAAGEAGLLYDVSYP